MYHCQNQFQTPGFTNVVRQFCGYQYFCCEILFYFVCLQSPFLESLKSKSIEMLKPQKGNLDVSFIETLLNFGLRDSENYENYALIFQTGSTLKILRVSLQTLDFCEILSKSPFRFISETFLVTQNIFKKVYFEILKRNLKNLLIYQLLSAPCQFLIS